MSARLDSIRACLEGAVPATIATCGADGTPNVSYVSEVHYVDSQHVALSYQFFNKTRANVMVNPQATVLLPHPEGGAQYRMSLEYLRTETSGPLFERMRAKLAGIASHTGMTDVFRLRGSDVYRVGAIECLPGVEAPADPPHAYLTALRAVTATIGRAATLEALVDDTLSGLADALGVDHAMLFMHDAPGARLYLLGSRGYAGSGVGTEIPLGHGVIGVSARQRTPIRITHPATEYAYGRAIRGALVSAACTADLEMEIPYPGLAEPGSQLAVPIEHGGELIGVLFAESAEDGAFGYDEEDALVTVANALGSAIRLLQDRDDRAAVSRPQALSDVPVGGDPVRIRYFAVNSSVFLDQHYLIKGVAGAILWKLVSEHVASGRTEFSNRELRIDPDIRLPELSENLEARLVLLKRRLADRCEYLRIERTGRGRFRLQVSRPLCLDPVDAPRADAAPASTG